MATGTGSGGSGFLGRLKTGWTLTKDSIGVIRDHPKLLVFPLLAGISSVVFLVLLFVPLVLAEAVGGGLKYVVLFGLYFVTTFVSTYFSAALCHAANEAFHGRDPDLRESMRAVSGSLGPIVVWSLISATVSVVFRILENSDNPLATVLRSLFAVGWAILTFFIVPVLVFEDVTATSMFERSGETFKNTWGETLGAGLASPPSSSGSVSCSSRVRSRFRSPSPRCSPAAASSSRSSSSPSRSCSRTSSARPSGESPRRHCTSTPSRA